MSVHRENVTWQRADGTWANGYWGYYHINSDSPSFDPEWDVAYTSEFDSVYIGTSPKDAMSKYLERNPNPGGTWIIENTPKNKHTINEYEKAYSRMLARDSKARKPIRWF